MCYNNDMNKNKPIKKVKTEKKLKIETSVKEPVKESIVKTSCSMCAFVSVSGNTVKGLRTQFILSAKIGNQIAANGEIHNITGIVSDTELTTDSWKNEATEVAYVIIK